MKSKFFNGLVFAFYAAAAAFTIVWFDGTGDSGDSVMHYLFARYAPQHPELFFDLWAKPIFVILACPFAQLGFVGMKIFNALLVLFTLWFTWQSAVKLKMHNASATLLIIIFAPLYYILTFSGLTEPLFALFVSMILYFSVREKWLVAALLASLIPFVRSEGLIILGVFAVYILHKRQWKYLLLLPVGHILFSIAGSFVHHDLLWVFSKNPYTKLSSTYGSGSITHFAEKMVYVVGVPIFGLLILGFLKTAWQAIRNKLSSEFTILVFLGFSGYFAAHTLFFYLGIFNSMGLHRVMIGVMPLIAILALNGLNTLTTDVFRNQIALKCATAAIILLVVIFPFLHNRAAVNWNKDMTLGADMLAAQKISNELLKTDMPQRRYLFSHSGFSETLDVDYFDTTRHQLVKAENISKLKSGDVIIWDNWFAVVENGVSFEAVDTLSNFRKVMTEAGESQNSWRFEVYEKK